MKEDTSRFINLENRLIEFAVCCFKISDGIKNNSAGRHLKNQLIRSGSSPALNYAEARRTESKKDFIHKVKIVLKELHETDVCLKIIAKTNSYQGNYNHESAARECNELISIFVTSVNTAQKNLATKKPSKSKA